MTYWQTAIEAVHAKSVFLIKISIVYLTDFTLKFSINICIFTKNRHLFGLDIGKINICGDILVTRCHLKIRVFSSS